jgi:hypothetical protein
MPRASRGKRRRPDPVGASDMRGDARRIRDCEGALPLPVFLKVRILKEFKFCVLEMQILNALWVSFADVRNLKGLSPRGE